MGFGAEENDGDGEGKAEADKEEEASESAYGEVSKLTLLPASSKIEGAIAIMDIPDFIKGLPLFPYHKILEWTWAEAERQTAELRLSLSRGQGLCPVRDAAAKRQHQLLSSSGRCRF